jgi:hypothetical protein
MTSILGNSVTQVAAVVGAVALLLTGRAALADEVRVFAAAAVPQPALAAQQQMRAQLEPLLKVELSFVNRVCTLSDAQRRTLVAKSNAWLDGLVRDDAQRGGQPQPMGVWMAGRGGVQHTTGPRESIQAAVVKLVKAELPDEQAAVYEEECRKRAEFQQKVAVENLIARIDAQLKLSPQQREKLAGSLTKHWDNSWAPQIEWFVHGMDAWPNVPDQWIRPYLTAAQQLAWGRLNKAAGHAFFGGNVFGDGQVIDDIDLTEGQGNADGGAEQPPGAAADAARN